MTRCLSRSTASPAAPARPGQTGAGGGQHSLLRLRLGTEQLAIALDHVRAVVAVPRLTPLPQPGAVVRGVMSRFGTVVPVIDLSALLGLGSAAVGRRSCVIVVDAPAIAGRSADDAGRVPLDDAPLLGLLVEEVTGLIDVATGDVGSAAPPHSRISAGLLAGTVQDREQAVGWLALGPVLALESLGAEPGAPSLH